MNEMNQQPKSSKVSALFWWTVVFSTAPFAILFVSLVASPEEPLPIGKWLLAGVIGLLPALLLGLIVEALYHIAKATLDGTVIAADYVFMGILALFCAALGWVFWILPDPWGENVTLEIFWLALFPMIGFHLRRRNRQSQGNQIAQQDAWTATNQPRGRG